MKLTFKFTDFSTLVCSQLMLIVSTMLILGKTMCPSEFHTKSEDFKFTTGQTVILG